MRFHEIPWVSSLLLMPCFFFLARRPCSSLENAEFARRSGRQSHSTVRSFFGIFPSVCRTATCPVNWQIWWVLYFLRSDMTSQQILQEIGNMAMLDHPNAGSSQDGGMGCQMTQSKEQGSLFWFEDHAHADEVIKVFEYFDEPNFVQSLVVLLSSKSVLLFRSQPCPQCFLKCS